MAEVDSNTAVATPQKKSSERGVSTLHTRANNIPQLQVTIKFAIKAY